MRRGLPLRSRDRGHNALTFCGLVWGEPPCRARSICTSTPHCHRARPAPAGVGLGPTPRPTPEEMADLYAEHDLFGVLLAINDESVSGVPYTGNDEIAALVARWPDRFIGFASVDPAPGASGRPGDRASRPRSRLARAQVPTRVRSASMPMTPTLLPALGVSARTAGARAVPHRHDAAGPGAPGGGGVQFGVDQTDAVHRRCGGRVSRSDDHHGPPGLALAGRATGDAGTQAELLYGPLRLGDGVRPAQLGPVRQYAGTGQGPVRQ